MTVVVGSNGVGKTNLYAALRLTQAAAVGTLGRSIAEEGGLTSLLWAGPRPRKEPVRVVLGARFRDLEYVLELGLAQEPPSSPFRCDPEVKEERLLAHVADRPVVLLERSGNSAFARDADGQRVQWPLQLWSGESVLSQIRDPGRFPILAELSVRLGRLRFYHHFDVGRSSPIRAPQVGVRTGLLSDDGRDLAAAIATIEDIGDARGFHGAVSRAFPGSTVAICAADGVFSLTMRMSGLTRALAAHELSDGTLRFLCLAAALTAPRPPSFCALNEPESSLHPDVLPALAERIAAASEHTQLLVTTHSRSLADAIAAHVAVAPLTLVRDAGETKLAPSHADPRS